MDHVGVVVDDLEAAISFFVELGMELDGGTTPVEGDWVDRVADSMRFESRSHSSGRPTVMAGSS
jgi:catechol 2,3-dioxygenase-like lactoylglutathione lyase family enzyme